MDTVSAQLEGIFLAHRPELLAFLLRLGAGDGAEDVLQEMWLRLPRDNAQVHRPRGYLYRMATSLLIDRERSLRQGAKRDTVWSEVTGPVISDQSEQATPDRILEAREAADQAFKVVAEQGARAARVFRRHRIDGLTQKEVALELGISVGTVEGDLRRTYGALIAFRENYGKD